MFDVLNATGLYIIVWSVRLSCDVYFTCFILLQNSVTRDILFWKKKSIRSSGNEPSITAGGAVLPQPHDQQARALCDQELHPQAVYMQPTIPVWKLLRYSCLCLAAHETESDLSEHGQAGHGDMDMN